MLPLGLFTKLVPYRIPAYILFSSALLSIGFFKGKSHVQTKWDNEKTQQSLQISHIQKTQAEVTNKVVTQYVDRIKTVREKGSVIIKEIPKYVPAKANNACILHNGFVRLHDASAANKIPESPGITDAAPTEITLSTATETIAGNYGICHETAEQLTALQQWVKAQELANDAK